MFWLFSTLMSDMLIYFVLVCRTRSKATSLRLTNFWWSAKQTPSLFSPPFCKHMGYFVNVVQHHFAIPWISFIITGLPKLCIRLHTVRIRNRSQKKEKKIHSRNSRKVPVYLQRVGPRTHKIYIIMRIISIVFRKCFLWMVQRSFTIRGHYIHKS